jgi:hypothetical protein
MEELRSFRYTIRLGVTVVLRWRYSGVTVVLQWRYRSVTGVLQYLISLHNREAEPHTQEQRERKPTIVLQGCYNGVTRVSQVCYKGVSSV